ncbi:serine hydrolase domain-containing protein [Parahaliea mediterranea]|uniref:Serine hydrolase n=1 Tax=Parahaliea mediterranea TaxID=651086 RepID=A0A939DGI1_9GAMM|nr:serine hydrolase [Parahaliea mediterranea]MBN7797638.1 serine hydrolase [Parahaliea mediterranea]
MEHSLRARRRYALILAVAGLLVFAVVVAKLEQWFPPGFPDSTTMGAGAGAKLACSGVYLQGRAPDQVVERDLRPFNSPLLARASFSFDAGSQTASAEYYGFFKRTALYRPGLGCTLMIDADRADLLAQAEGIPIPQMPAASAEAWPAGRGAGLADLPAGASKLALEAAIDAAFAEDAPGTTIDTRALVVVQDGRLIAERYAPGFDRESRFLAWSASKSITSALIGTLVTDGELDLDAAAPIPAWRSDDDARGAITLRHLLTMTDGLAFVEHPYGPGNDSTNMLFKEADMAAYTAARPLAHDPGTHWSYSSGTTNLLSQILFDSAGSNLAGLQDFVWSRFFGPAGMHSSVFEVDVSGAQVGSSYFYATARDWARFGLLFLNEGEINGQQLLSPEYVRFAVTPIAQAPEGRYGGQFWLNAGDPQDPGKRFLPDAPRDLFMAAGFNGQFIVVVPSRNTVIVRAGWTNGEAAFDINRHVAAILAALPEVGAETGPAAAPAR